MPTSLLALGALLSIITLLAVMACLGIPALWEAIEDAFKEKG